ncbi:2-oxo acid dehydrogenase subunit E2 [Beijerinckiaceae bacterium]|nr:2-oxo acid dehydrogenase subunit E2 [Beijerinckiaceae bacterium]
MVEFRMPSLGADMEAGTLVEWLVKPGDRVKRGDVVAVVETQKGAIEIEIFETGEIEQILVDLGAKVPVGTPLAEIRTDKEEVKAGMVARPAREALEVAASVPITAPPGAVPPAAPVPLPLSAGRVQASPAARQFAQIHDVDLASITGTGPAGAIVREDVERKHAAVVRPIEKKRALGLDLDAMRGAIAAAMARSKREIPHYYLEHQVDVTPCEAWLARTNATRPPESRLLMGAVAMKAVALAAHRFPAFNGFYLDEKFEPSSAVHVGMAIAIRGGGLAAPAIHDANRLSCDALMASMRDLVARMRSGRIRSSEIADATITVSSLGERGVEALYGIIYPPQVAIVGVGKVVARPWIVDDAIVPRSIVTITLSGDHRVSDGHAGALFLAEIGKLLQEPDQL